jgi:hypothetical protein
MEYLPAEILSSILLYFKDKPYILLKCTLVCTRWKHVLDQLWKLIYRETISFFPDRFPKELNSIRNYKKAVLIFGENKGQLDRSEDMVISCCEDLVSYLKEKCPIYLQFSENEVKRPCSAKSDPITIEWAKLTPENCAQIFYKYRGKNYTDICILLMEGCQLTEGYIYQNRETIVRSNILQIRDIIKTIEEHPKSLNKLTPLKFINRGMENYRNPIILDDKSQIVVDIIAILKSLNIQ